MAEPNPQPVQEAAPQAAPAKGGGGVMGPIVAAIIIVAGIAGIFEFMVKGALTAPGVTTSPELSAEQKPGGGGDGSVAEGVDTYQTPYDLGEPILVNIKGENNLVLSAKVGFILNTKAKKKETRSKLLEKIDEFKPMLVDAARAYLSKISEADWDNEEVHKMFLQKALNRKFGAIRKNVESDGELGGKGILPNEPVDSILLPSFTAQ